MQSSIIEKHLLFLDNTRTLHRLTDYKFPITVQHRSCRGFEERFSDCPAGSLISYSIPCVVDAVNITCSGMAVDYAIFTTYVSLMSFFMTCGKFEPINKKPLSYKIKFNHD